MDEKNTKIQLIPKSSRDRRLIQIAAFSASVAIALSFVADDFIGHLLTVANSVGAVFCLTLAYAFQDREDLTGRVDYEGAINQLEETRKSLEKLGNFLEGEQKRVAETELTLKKLEAEKAALEPVVNTQRETVDAILLAHSKTQRRNIWQDRAIGFGLGGFYLH